MEADGDGSLRGAQAYPKRGRWLGGATSAASPGAHEGRTRREAWVQRPDDFTPRRVTSNRPVKSRFVVVCFACLNGPDTYLKICGFTLT
jgi:hypothetical protein